MVKKRHIRGAALCLAVILALAGCKPEKTVMYETETLPQNDGRPGRLGGGVPAGVEGAGPVMEEIVEKYRADYPQTEISLQPQGSGAQQPDIRVVTDSGLGDQADGLLDFSLYADAWYNEGSLGNATGLAMRYMGRQGMYAVPVDVRQDLLFYRTDWITAHNKGKPWEEQVNLEAWDRAGLMPLLMGEQGRLAISRDKVSRLFSAVMWSVLGVHTASAPYYSPSKDGLSATSIFTGENAPSALITFDRLMGSVPGGGYADEAGAVQAFINGDAGLLIAGSEALETIRAAMPAESWQVAGLPAGATTQTATVPCQWVGWGVSRQTAQPEKAVHFLAYLTNADNNTHMAKVCGTLPIYREAVSMEPTLLEGARAPEMALLQEASYRYSGVPRCLEGFCWEESPFAGQLETYLAGGLSGEELLAQLDALCIRQLDTLKPGWPLPWLEEEEEEG